MGHSGPIEERTVNKECAPDNSSSSPAQIFTGSVWTLPDGGIPVLANAVIQTFKQYKLNNRYKD